MSSKEQDLKDAIKGAKNKYVGIDRIIFYINREFSASSAKDKDKPEHQIRIEKYGKNLGIEIQWRGQSHIEKMLAMEELRYVKNLYFNVETGIDHFHESLINHKNSILKHIHSTIKYGEKDIKIAQDYQKLMDFQESDSQVLIIHGAAGTGKSATVKDFLLKKDKKTEDEVTVVFSAADLDVKEENLFLKEENYGLQDLFGLYKNEKYRLCVIDSAEKYATARYPEVFGDILQQFLDHGWKVIITIRTFYKDSLCNLFLKNYVRSEQEILKLEKDTLTEMSAQYQFALPADTKLQDLLCNLFYLNLYLNLNHRSEDENMNIVLFREAIWSQVIRDDFQQYNNLPVKRETFIQRMVCDMLAHERYTYSLKDTDEFETVSALENSGIIVPYQESRSDWLVSHDVYEEIVTSHIFTKRFKEEAYSGKIFFAESKRENWMGKIECKLSIYQEKLNQKYCDVNIVFNQRDAQLYQKYYGEMPDAIIPISTPTPEIDWEKAAWSNEKSDIMQVLFVGSKYYPNIIGIKWFYKNVLPKLNNNIIINIVGRGTEILKKELTDCRIRIYGSVDSLAPYYMGADVIIAPLFDGGGMKTKTVEALSYGKSIVATDEGLEGFWQEMDSTIQNRFVFKTNDENEWIKKLNEMSKEKPLKYNQEVFDLFVKKFSYEATRDAMWNVL